MNFSYFIVYAKQWIPDVLSMPEDKVSTVCISTNTSPQAEVSRVKQHYEGVAGRARADVERAWLGERGRMAQEIRLLEARVAQLMQGLWCAELVVD